MIFTLSELIDLKYEIYNKVKLTQDQRKELEKVIDDLVLDKSKNIPPTPVFPINRGIDDKFMQPVGLPKTPDQDTYTITC
jgi:hypothetical protein